MTREEAERRIGAAYLAQVEMAAGFGTLDREALECLVDIAECRPSVGGDEVMEMAHAQNQDSKHYPR